MPSPPRSSNLIHQIHLGASHFTSNDNPFNNNDRKRYSRFWEAP